jgi:hypothetical protein
MPRRLKELEKQNQRPEDIFEGSLLGHKLLSLLASLGDKIFKSLIKTDQENQSAQPSETESKD